MASGFAPGLAVGCLTARALAALAILESGVALPWGQTGMAIAVATLGAGVVIAGCAWQARLLMSAGGRQQA